MQAAAFVANSVGVECAQIEFTVQDGMARVLVSRKGGHVVASIQADTLPEGPYGQTVTFSFEPRGSQGEPYQLEAQFDADGWYMVRKMKGQHPSGREISIEDIVWRCPTCYLFAGEYRLTGVALDKFEAQQAQAAA